MTLNLTNPKEKGRLKAGGGEQRARSKKNKTALLVICW